MSSGSDNAYDAIQARKLKLAYQRQRQGATKRNIEADQYAALEPLTEQPKFSEIDEAVLRTLNNIETTPYDNSFLCRLQGSISFVRNGYIIGLDWTIQSAWMDLMDDIRDHYTISHPREERQEVVTAPIVYTCLQESHICQVHEILEKAFWDGIDVHESLVYYPEQCTVVALYKRLVVGVAIMSSPQEMYITYLAVRPGWDNSQIATSMLYHLIKLNPKRDVILHVSVNNPAMLLYNRFGFKAEEFITQFYENYLSGQSRASKNAFRLRLRQQ